MDSLKCKTAPPLWRKVWQFLIKLHVPLCFDLAIPPLDIYWKIKTYPQKSFAQECLQKFYS